MKIKKLQGLVLKLFKNKNSDMYKNIQVSIPLSTFMDFNKNTNFNPEQFKFTLDSKSKLTNEDKKLYKNLCDFIAKQKKSKENVSEEQKTQEKHNEESKNENHKEKSKNFKNKFKKAANFTSGVVATQFATHIYDKALSSQTSIEHEKEKITKLKELTKMTEALIEQNNDSFQKIPAIKKEITLLELELDEFKKFPEKNEKEIKSLTDSLVMKKNELHVKTSVIEKNTTQIMINMTEIFSENYNPSVFKSVINMAVDSKQLNLLKKEMDFFNKEKSDLLVTLKTNIELVNNLSTKEYKPFYSGLNEWNNSGYLDSSEKFTNYINSTIQTTEEQVDVEIDIEQITKFNMDY